MSLATRCTSCATAFRVVQDQLKVSEGWVRCGRCDAVFNALEGLFDLGRDAPADWEDPIVSMLAPSAPQVPEWMPVDPADEEAVRDEGPTSNLGELLADPIDARLFGPRKQAESAPKPAGQLGARDRVEFSDARFDSDLFPDNVFFRDRELTGLIDFYFACTDVFAYDLAICLNAWCFEPDGSFNVTKARLLIGNYRNERPLDPKEIAALPVLARGSALRFLLTRLYDWLNQTEGALVRPKDPLEYLKKLRFHRGIVSPAEYGIDA